MSALVIYHKARVIALRALTAIFIAAFASAALITASHAESLRTYAGIVVDAKTGKTLYASHADEARYPASITKVMTLYILFQELDAGRMSLTTKLKVSKHAAAAQPTKLGLPAGSTISVQDAIKSLVTISANDMARVIAENISGTESEFAERMTKTARALGMMHTTYKNASGLPNSRQRTTVRDQAILGAAIYEHFPTYYKFFQTRSFKYRGRTYSSHVPMVGSVPGVDGLKTGYINDAGYNLLTAARINGRHIIAVGFGFNTSASRNAKVAQLVNKYLPRAHSGDYYRTALITKPGTGSTRVAFAPTLATPQPRPSFRSMPGQQAPIPLDMPETVAVAMAEPTTAPAATTVTALISNAPTPASRPENLIPASAVEATAIVASNGAPTPKQSIRDSDVVGAWVNTTLKFEPGPGNEGLVPPAPITSGSRPQAGQTVDLMTSGSIDEPSDIDGWVIQIGAAPSEEGAQTLLASASNKIGQSNALRSYVQRIEKNGQIFYRARFAGFAERNQAALACDQLKQAKMSCLALQS